MISNISLIYHLGTPAYLGSPCN